MLKEGRTKLRQLTHLGIRGRLPRLMPSQALAPAQATYEFTRVDPDNPRCVEQIMELTQALAWRRFGGERNAEELVQDAVSLAWEFSQRAKGTPFTDSQRRPVLTVSSEC